jgi:hypothetical protein
LTELRSLISTRNQKIRVTLGVIITLAAVYFIPDRLLALIPLLLSWWLVFHPLTTGELVMFAVAATFFLFQNYVTLRAGLFEFRFKDILLMPYYEPLLWGFYFLSLKRFISGQARLDLRVDKKAIAAVVVTSLAFSVFSFDSRAIFLATACSTVMLFALFHEKLDVYYALCGLGLGFIVELFGVSTGLWWYPAPDFLGIPYWFATMWISVGLLGRRFLIPISEWLAARLRDQRA